MPSTRSLARLAGALALLSLSGVAAAQSPNPAAELGLGTRVGITFVVAAVLNAVLGGLLVGLGPRYARRRVEEIHDDPGSAFLWGLLVGIGVPIALALLAITIIGLIVTIPGLIVVAVLQLVGQAVTVVWIGDAATGRSGVGAQAVLAGAVVLALLAAVPVLGGLLTTLASFFGLGVVGRNLYEDW